MWVVCSIKSVLVVGTSSSNVASELRSDGPMLLLGTSLELSPWCSAIVHGVVVGGGNDIGALAMYR
jgi:hypothetical protein